jgi:hypothetical protein
MRRVRAISIGATLPTIVGPAAVRQAERDAMRVKIFAVEQDAAPSASAAPRPALIRPALIYANRSLASDGNGTPCQQRRPNRQQTYPICYYVRWGHILERRLHAMLGCQRVPPHPLDSPRFLLRPQRFCRNFRRNTSSRTSAPDEVSAGPCVRRFRAGRKKRAHEKNGLSRS